MSSLSRQFPLRWSIDERLYTWLMSFCDGLYLPMSAFVRMFLLQLKEGDPSTTGLVYKFVELGILDPIPHPKLSKAFVDREIYEWMKAYVDGLSHPQYPKRKVHVRHLLNGYVRFLQKHESECVHYGAIRLDKIDEVSA